MRSRWTCAPALVAALVSTAPSSAQVHGQALALARRLDHVRWTLELSGGPPGAVAPRASVLLGAAAWAAGHGGEPIPRFLPRDQAALAIDRAARDSAGARVSKALGVLLPGCAAMLSLAATKASGSAARAASIGVAATCGLGAILGARLGADAASLESGAGLLLPDAGAVLDGRGSWSGLVAESSGGAGRVDQLGPFPVEVWR